MPGPAAAPRSRLIIGTAGHVDHGKTALVRALTGVDTDRLPQEKARGISIELGFAALTFPDGRQAAVVDVPGHERFLRAMVAGATGVDLVLLVVAADEGVMPQTREHIDICGLLERQRGVVALTKIDLVDPELRELAIEDVRGALRGTFLQNAPIVPCSTRDGTGVDLVRAALARATADLPPRPSDGPARLPIDRVFTVKGFGTVVTGTMAGGRMEVGDEVLILPGGASGRVRSLEVHGQRREDALAGERAALNLAGLAQGRLLSRGRTVVRPGEMEASTCVDVALTWLPICPAPLGRRAEVLFHALTTQESATVSRFGESGLRPGETGIVRLHLQRPVALLPDDRFVLRGFRTLAGHGTTVGGGRVVRVGVPPRRRRDRQSFELAGRMATAQPDERVLLDVQAAGGAGLPRPLLGARTGLGSEALDRVLQTLQGAGRLAVLGGPAGQVITAAALAELERGLLARLQELHAEAPLAPGVPREALRTSTPGAGRLDPRVFGAVLERLAERGALTVDGDLLRKRGFSSREAESKRADLLDRVGGILTGAGLGPPSPREIAASVGAEVARITEALAVLVRRGDVVRVKDDLYFSREAIDGLRDRLRAFLAERGQITPQEWKAMAGVTRKFAIPLAEHFDAEKLTLRVGDLRRLRLLPGAKLR